MIELIAKIVSAIFIGVFAAGLISAIALPLLQNSNKRIGGPRQ